MNVSFPVAAADENERFTVVCAEIRMAWMWKVRGGSRSHALQLKKGGEEDKHAGSQLTCSVLTSACFLTAAGRTGSCGVCGDAPQR